ncbi:transglutaminase-like domain-containing protein [Janthinobacterium fluminis]|uniref:Transglutaminase family protein n=1 Tax=Janthinobacterium fluminis TaxID=2987524 RepID=A0ABT5K5I1_9BURK|nr:transglutaminase family protein [Janthinobacterium fluminis]MDC8759700.1 transglutaminase family protein [Janthinobacterium fluminis]
MSTSHPDPSPFLAASAVIDYQEPAVAALARSLSGATPTACAQRCYEWVRDNIEHSIDFGRDEVTCAASDALARGTGLCLAKSHLLVALLRANGIPAGLCYQRLTLSGGQPPYCTHGFVAVWLEGNGWYRCDARGNSKPGIDCRFTPGVEHLAYPLRHEGECTYPQVWAQPWPAVVDGLRALDSMAQYRAAPIDAAPPDAGAAA